MTFSWELSSFDTEILGFNVAKIISKPTGIKNNIHGEQMSNLQKEMRAKGIVYATYRLPANEYALIHSLENNRFLLVDGLVKLERSPVSQIDLFKLTEIATQKDLSQIIVLAGTVFNGVSRYYHDHEVISKKQADEIYKKWAENSVKRTAADAVLVRKENDKILGFITLNKKGQIPLIGVAEGARGRGIGKSLLHAALHQFSEWNVKNVTVETQTSNIAALQIYQKLGFRIVDSYLTYRWHA